MSSAIVVTIVLVTVLSHSVLIAPACANPPVDATGEPRLSEDTSEGLALLADVEDGGFAFDDEAFYWFCGHARSSPPSLAGNCAADAVVPWRFLMERPSDYRGQSVCIEGRLLRIDPAYEVAGRPGVGVLYQVELGVPGSGAIATVVLVDPPPKVTKRSLVRARAYFIKVRSFRTEGGGEGAGPLFVAGTFEVIESPKGHVGTGTLKGRDLLPWMGGFTIFLFVVMVVLRRRVAATSPTVELPPGRHGPTGTDADFGWMDERVAGEYGDAPRDADGRSEMR